MMAEMTPVDAAPFTLRNVSGKLRDGIDVLDRELDAVPLRTVLDNGNRTATRKGRTTAWGSMRTKPVDWFCFQSGDDDTTDWYPQGVTCASDAGVADPAFLVSWYWRPEEGERGARVSALDPETGKYQHILLVKPEEGGSFGPIDIHAGGIAWYGTTLYVADTVRGLRAFSLERILDMRTGRDDVGDKTKIGRHGGALHAFGYRYIMPQTGMWQVETRGPRFSFVAVDRSGERDLLISGEYTDGPGGELGRVARWPLASSGALDASGAAVDAFRMPGHRIQGALSHEGTWYFSQTAGARGNGTLIVTRPGEKVTARPYPVGPEDLTCWREKKTVWSVAEFPGRRALFAVPL
ncbi:hypothetical protein GCM10023259_060300 [Thermocatellispora tengchongensis]